MWEVQSAFSFFAEICCLYEGGTLDEARSTWANRVGNDRDETGPFAIWWVGIVGSRC